MNAREKQARQRAADLVLEDAIADAIDEIREGRWREARIGMWQAGEVADRMLARAS